MPYVPTLPPVTSAMQEGTASDHDSSLSSMAAVTAVTPIFPPTVPPATLRPLAALACYGCRGRRFWISVYGVTVCAICHPPPDPALVAAWLPADGATDV